MHEVILIHNRSNTRKVYEFENPYLMDKFLRKMASFIQKGYYNVIYIGEK